jgi:hypothetical protein
VLLGGFLLVLAVACLGALRAAGDGAARGETDARAGGVATTTSTAREVRATFAAVVGDSAGCQTLSGVEPQLLCPIPDGVVTYTQVANPMKGYASVAGTGDAVAARGDAACATGRTDERAWARPGAPAIVAGRYFCRVDGARAEMWWTVDDAGLLGHAHRRDDDLVALFSWWRARSEEAPDHP